MMNFSLFTPDDWQEFREANPSAYQHLLTLSLRAERRAGHKELRSKCCDGARREWLEKRIAELDALHADGIL